MEIEHMWKWLNVYFQNVTGNLTEALRQRQVVSLTGLLHLTKYLIHSGVEVKTDIIYIYIYIALYFITSNGHVK